MLKETRVYLLAPNPTTPNFYAQWVEPGSTRRRTRSLRTADPGLAEKRRADLEYELNHDLADTSGRLSWEAFLTRYDEEKLAGLKATTRHTALKMLRLFAEKEKPRSVGSVDARMVSRWMAGLRARGLKQPTLLHYQAHLKAALRWAHNQGLRPPCPRMDKIKLPKKSHIRTVPDARLQALLCALPGPWAFLVRVAWYTGLRVGELYLLRWESTPDGIWVDLDRARIWISAGACKGGADRFVPIHPDLLDLLRERAQATGPLFSLAPNAQELSHRFCRLCKKLGFDVKTHDLRRTFASRYAPHVPAPILKALLGHQDIRTTLGFYTDVEGALDQAITKAGSGLPPSPGSPPPPPG